MIEGYQLKMKNKNISRRGRCIQFRNDSNAMYNQVYSTESLLIMSKTHFVLLYLSGTKGQNISVLVVCETAFPTNTNVHTKTSQFLGFRVPYMFFSLLLSNIV